MPCHVMMMMMIMITTAFKVVMMAILKIMILMIISKMRHNLQDFSNAISWFYFWEALVKSTLTSHYYEHFVFWAVKLNICTMLNLFEFLDFHIPIQAIPGISM